PICATATSAPTATRSRSSARAWTGRALRAPLELAQHLAPDQPAARADDEPVASERPPRSGVGSDNARLGGQPRAGTLGHDLESDGRLSTSWSGKRAKSAPIH